MTDVRTVHRCVRAAGVAGVVVCGFAASASEPAFGPVQLVQVIEEPSGLLAEGRSFGWAMGFDGETLAVATVQETPPGSGAWQHTLEIYSKSDADAWHHRQSFDASFFATGDAIWEIVVSGDWIAVSDRTFSSPSTGQGNGRVLMFRRESRKGSDRWALAQELVPPVVQPEGDERFGQSVSIDGGLMVVGAQRHLADVSDCDAVFDSVPGTVGPSPHAYATNTGWAYVYALDPASGRWEQAFGLNPAVCGDVANRDRLPRTRAGEPHDGAFGLPFVHDGGCRVYPEVWDHPREGPGLAFGNSVSLHGTRAAIGQYGYEFPGWNELNGFHVFDGLGRNNPTRPTETTPAFTRVGADPVGECAHTYAQQIALSDAYVMVGSRGKHNIVEEGVLVLREGPPGHWAPNEATPAIDVPAGCGLAFIEPEGTPTNFAGKISLHNSILGVSTNSRCRPDGDGSVLPAGYVYAERSGGHRAWGLIAELTEPTIKPERADRRTPGGLLSNKRSIVIADRYIALAAPWDAAGNPEQDQAGRVYIYRVSLPDCRVDFDCDGRYTHHDAIIFATDALAGDFGADLNDDGSVDVHDVGAFGAAYLAGCE